MQRNRADFAADQIFSKLHRMENVHMLTESARAARTGQFGAERHQTADRATLADVYGRDHRAPLHFTAGKPALLTFQPMYTNYGHLNRSYGRTILLTQSPKRPSSLLTSSQLSV